MKRIMFVVMVVLLALGKVYASEDPNIRIGITNGNTSTNTNTNGNTNNNDNKNSNTNTGSGTATAITYGNFPEVGFVGFLNPGTPIVGSDFRFYYKDLYSRLDVQRIETMRWGFHFSDLWPTKWGGRVQYTPERDPLPENNDAIHLMHYWPEDVINPGDEILGSVEVFGEPNWTDAPFLGEAAFACKANTMTRRIAVSYTQYIDGVTLGGSVGASGTTAGVSDSSGYAVAGGAVLGKNRVRAEKVARFRVLCMNDGPLYLPAPKKPCPPKVETTPPPPPPAEVKKPCPPKAEPAPKVCSDERLAKIFKKIRETEVLIKGDKKKGIKGCPTWCKRNMCLHAKQGNNYMNAFACTREMKYIHLAIKQFEIAERNFFYSGLYAQHNAEIDAFVAAEIDRGLASAIYARDKAVDAYYKVTWEKQRIIRSRFVVKHEMIIKVRERLESFSTEINP